MRIQTNLSVPRRKSHGRRVMMALIAKRVNYWSTLRQPTKRTAGRCDQWKKLMQVHEYAMFTASTKKTDLLLMQNRLLMRMLR